MHSYLLYRVQIFSASNIHIYLPIYAIVFRSLWVDESLYSSSLFLMLLALYLVDDG